jgi:hypothetical protein
VLFECVTCIDVEFITIIAGWSGEAIAEKQCSGYLMFCAFAGEGFGKLGV